MYLCLPLAREKAKLVLAQDVSFVQKLNGSQPWAFVFPHPFALDLSTKTVLLPVFSLLARHCYIPTEKHCPLPPAMPHCPRALPGPFPGHCMTREGTEECGGLLSTPACLVLASFFGIAVGSRKLSRLGHCAAARAGRMQHLTSAPRVIPSHQAWSKERGLWM